MATNLSLDEMILQYSENPFIDEKMFTAVIKTGAEQKRKILSRLLLVATRLFNKTHETELSSYKRRYEFK
jgi:hypothetical protein